MTETPERKVTGLAPRGTSTPDLSRLRKRNREADPVPTIAAESAPTKQLAAPAAEGEETDDKTVSVTFYMRRTIRARAKAVFRATRHLEQDDSWSAFLEGAILAEVRRREEAYNEGRPYPGDDRRLSPGRSI
ncbi:hypothetical protein KK090_15155 [Curtobacterium flaccumfaciens pv. poinsettiae]|uniref:ParB family protein n=1 Tax=Curtobacterium poinsettiae TaxID=159612 RepID=UPI001BE0DD2C|nr:hypothetical protein [Curtobacterium flaccumfaciens]MBT1620598.1 hypothetical protein [Curtobacterium flaccumfaciens pv. poinsettiae]WQM79378.1 hypothetical protein PCFP11_155 [Curtobacterium flaccumfaciens pv. poinsettiae]